MNMQHAWDHIPGGIKLGLDLCSVSVIIGTLSDNLPAIAAGLSVVWTTIRIYETQTVASLLADLPALRGRAAAFIASIPRRIREAAIAELLRRIAARLRKNDPDNSK